MDKDSKIFVAGHKGMVGSAIVRILKESGYFNLLLKSRKDLDLACQQSVVNFFEKEKPEYVFMAAAKVGGILANSTYPADFIYENLAIQTNIIHESYVRGVKRLIFLGSSCIYPRDCPQPIKEEYFLTGPLEKTNDAYALAKIAGIKMCQAYNYQYKTQYLAVMPTNLYGPNDNFDLETSHVIPALVRKFVDAHKNNYSHVEVWGTGDVMREFLHVDDLALASVILMNSEWGLLRQKINLDLPLINVGCGEDMTIKKLALLIAELVGYKGKVTWDTTKPNGTPKKLLDVSKMCSLNWKHRIDIKQGLRQEINSYKESVKNERF